VLSGPFRCPHCQAADIQPMLDAVYAADREVIWYRCKKCRRMWSEQRPPPRRSANDESSQSS